MAGTYSTDYKISEGQRLFAYFFNKAATYPDFNWTWDSLKIFINEKYPNGPSFFELVGKWALEGTIQENDIKAHMEAVAEKGKGALPVHWSDFIKAVYVSPTPSFIDSIEYAILPYAISAAETVQNVGESLMFAGFSGIALIGMVALGGFLLTIGLARAH